MYELNTYLIEKCVENLFAAIDDCDLEGINNTAQDLAIESMRLSKKAATKLVDVPQLTLVLK